MTDRLEAETTGEADHQVRRLLRRSRTTFADDGRTYPRSRWTRTGLIVSAAVAAELGIWATLFPRSFYDDFPGGGRSWVSADGPYNEHLVRDFGGLQLALAVLAGVAAWRLGHVLVRTAAVALLAFAVPHLVYHLRHLEHYDGSDKVANSVLLAIAAAIPLTIIIATFRQRGTDVRDRS